MIGNMAFQFITLLHLLLIAPSLLASLPHDMDPPIKDLPGDENLHQKMKPEDINTYVSYIQQGKFDLVFRELAQSHDDESIHKIVKNAYDKDINNFNTILTFARNLVHMKHSAIAFKTLYNEMKLNNQLNTSEIFLLAIKIKEHMIMTHYDELKQRYKNMFQEVKTSLPYIVRLLVWQGSAVCILKNDVFNEYMYAGSWIHKGFSKLRNVYTWTPGSVEDGARWNFTVVGGGTVIQNIYYGNEYLVADDNGKVKTTASESIYNSTTWQIEPQDSNDLVKIKTNNLYLGAYNYGIGIIMQRRAVGVQNTTLWEHIFVNDSVAKHLDLWKMQCN